jgi:hypothetical protein
MLCSIPDMPVGAERRKKIVEMVALFKQYNR